MSETSTEKGSTNVAEKTQPMLGKCIECKQMPSSSESDHLCYDCHMSAKGFEYDGETNLYIKRIDTETSSMEIKTLHPKENSCLES